MVVTTVSRLFPLPASISTYLQFLWLYRHRHVLIFYFMRSIIRFTFFHRSMFFLKDLWFWKTGIILRGTWPELLSAGEIVHIRYRDYSGYSVHLGFLLSCLSGWGGPVQLSRSTCAVRMTSVRLQVLDGMTTALMGSVIFSPILHYLPDQLVSVDFC